MPLVKTSSTRLMVTVVEYFFIFRIFRVPNMFKFITLGLYVYSKSGTQLKSRGVFLSHNITNNVGQRKRRADAQYLS